MNMVIPNAGKEMFLDRCMTGGSYEDVKVELYTNNYTPIDTSVTADFTAATFTGSGPITLTAGDWDAVVIVSNVAEQQALVAPEWTHGGGAAQVCYGWFMYGDSTGTIYAAQRFDTARNMTPGSIESLDPFKFKLKTFV